MSATAEKPRPGWIVILGVTGAIGSACARAFARLGYGVYGVHLDSSERDQQVGGLLDELRAFGADVHFANMNAANEPVMKQTVAEAAELMGSGSVRVFIHALAFGSLLPFIKRSAEDEVIGPRQMQMTMSVMAHSLVYWVQELRQARLLRPQAKVFAMTSIGSAKVVANYGAVSAAKAALEAHVRQLAFELAPEEIAVNAIRAGVVDSPALRKIPQSQQLVDRARQYNPFGRLTTVDDVAQAIVLLAAGQSAWMTGNIFNVDGGEIFSA